MSSHLTQSTAVGDFLKQVYFLQQHSDRVATNDLAEALKISAPSVTDMARRLVDAGLIDHQKYQGVRLTDQGETQALQLIRRHRLIELYLCKQLGYGAHEVHDEAEVLEHAVSDRFVDVIFEKLGRPTHDPHGDPIPGPDGAFVRRELIPLSELELNVRAIVRRYDTQDDEMLSHILSRGFNIGQSVLLMAQDPFQGPLSVQINDQKVVIGYQVAKRIMVDADNNEDDTTVIPRQ
jgi:DtxR family transcriptional regulator, Mn-dependent transcriptional regulator